MDAVGLCFEIFSGLAQILHYRIVVQFLLNLTFDVIKPALEFIEPGTARANGTGQSLGADYQQAHHANNDEFSKANIKHRGLCYFSICLYSGQPRMHRHHLPAFPRQRLRPTYFS